MTATLPHAVQLRLERSRQDLEFAPGHIAAVLELANTLLHACDWLNKDPSPLATHTTICALVNCARLATNHLDEQIGDLLGALEGDAA